MAFRNNVRNKPLGTISPGVIENLFKGSFDMHIHPGPDPVAERPWDSGTIAKKAAEAGMGGIVLKSFFYPTGSDAFLIRKHLTPDLNVFGSVVIAYNTTAGLSRAADVIEKQAKMGAKVVWFPAMDAAYCQSYLGREGGICILKEDGTLKDEVFPILQVIKDYRLVVCSGHMSYEETAALFDAARGMGITKMVATHPLAELSRFTMEQIKDLVAKGAYIEHVYGTLMPRLGSMDPSDYVDCVKEVGAEHCIMGTDLAQVWDFVPCDGMRHYIAMMIQFGCTPEEVEYMVKTNPAKLLDVQL